MSYVQDNLMPNEKVLYSARIHPAVFIPAVLPFLLSVAMAILYTSWGGLSVLGDVYLPLFILGLAGLFLLNAITTVLRAIIIMFTTEFAITNRRVIAKTGFIRRHMLEMLLSKIESVAVHQDILGRVLNFGSVTVTGTGGTKESFKAIVEPLAVRSRMNQIIETYTQANFQTPGNPAPAAGNQQPLQ